jgi:pantoate--beta-alanine ligase
LKRCAFDIDQRIAVETALETARASLAEVGFAVDYVEARHAETLAAIESRAAGSIRLLAAARLGRTRLIDNVPG